MVKKKVLFICTHNSCRSQIAEGLLNTIYGSKYEAYSAGIKPTNVNSYAIEVMKEIGIDLSKHYSKNIEDFRNQKFDLVVTVCDNAKETCPFFPGKKIIHKNFENPAEFNGFIKDILDRFRRIRDEIKTWIIAQFR
ncbi:ArsC family transcriptional regulator [Thermoplasmatales archaeon SG8-52-1]|nr:MAG: ArsC family transcriptional regulator [Thermoplasmatales archaeon SG8-52-1]